MNETSPKQPSLTITILLVILSLAFSLAWIWQMVFVIPEFERLFAEFRLVLPSHTEATIHASRFAVRYWYVVVLFTLFIAYPAIGYVSYHLRHRSNQRGLTRLWFVLILCLPLAMQTLTLLSVLSTESTLLTNLSG